MSQRAALYLRQSLDKTGQGLAVDRQRTACRKLAKAKGMRVVAEYVDNDVSASSTRPRPEFSRLLADAEAGRFEVVLAWHLDRLTRTLRDLETLIEVSERTGVRFATASGDVDLTTDSGRLVGRILASVARGEVERKAARQVAAARQRAEAGLPYGAGARAFGYTQDGLQVVESEAAVVRELYARLLAGETLTGLTRWLDETGVPTRHGRPWNRITVRKILRAPRYAAIATYRGAETGQAKWPPIVDEATLRAAQGILADPKRKLNRVGNARAHLGSGLYRCADCGGPVRTTGPTRAFAYLCPGHLARTGRHVDEWVELAIGVRLSHGADVAGLLARDEADRAEPLRIKAAALRLRLDQATDDYAAGLLDARQLARATERIRADLAAVEDELAAVGRTAGLGAVLAAPDPGAAFLTAPLMVRRAVVDKLATITLHKVAPSEGRRPPDAAVWEPPGVELAWRTEG